jgi:hypothetical protein
VVYSQQRGRAMRGMARVGLLLFLCLGASAASAASCPNGCDDGNPCTDDLCDPVLGCLHYNNSAACNDGNSCTTGDVCHMGTCVGGDAAPGCAPCDAVANLPANGGSFVGNLSTGSVGGGSLASGERVYRWLSPSSGIATIGTCGNGTNFNTAVHLRGQSCDGSEITPNGQTPCAVSGSPGGGSQITPSVTAGQTYYIAVDGVNGASGTFELNFQPPHTCGNNVREGPEACDGTDASNCPSGQCTPTCTCVPPPGGLPDLWPEITDWSIEENATVAQGDFAEGCAESLTGATLLRFGVSTHNDGTKNFELGAPECPSPCSAHPLEVCTNPEFICSPAQGHNHPHYSNYARYELLDPTTQAIVIGHKQGFCLLDSDAACTNRTYSCNFQGISVGCSDLYESSIGCQYLDITGVPAGQYTLRVTVDPYNKVAELDKTNNVTEIPVTIPPSTCPDPITTIPPQGGTFSGTTSGASMLSGPCGASALAPEMVFAFTPTVSGTAIFETCGAGTKFDTVMFVQDGACVGGKVVGCNDDFCPIADGTNRGSYIQLSVTAGHTYTIVVDGYGTASGDFVLTVTPPSPPPPRCGLLGIEPLLGVLLARILRGRGAGGKSESPDRQRYAR